MRADHNHVLDELRARIAHLEHGHSHRHAPLPTGVAAVDAHLGGGLPRGALHEIIGGGADLLHGAAAALFAASLLGGDSRTVLWVLPARDLFAPGLAAAGLHPDRLIYAETGDAAAVLPVAEDALRHRGLAGVVAEPARLSLTASRRLQLAAEVSGVTALVVRRWTGKGEAVLSGTVAVTRWRLTALALVPPARGSGASSLSSRASSPALASAALGGVSGLGDPRWRLELLRYRGGAPGAWILEACDETGRLRLAADVADRPAETGIRRATG